MTKDEFYSGTRIQRGVNDVPGDVRAARNDVQNRCFAEEKASSLIGSARRQVRVDCEIRGARAFCEKRQATIDSGGDPMADFRNAQAAQQQEQARVDAARKAEWHARMAAASTKAKNQKLRSAARRALLNAMKAPATTHIVREFSRLS